MSRHSKLQSRYLSAVFGLFESQEKFSLHLGYREQLSWLHESNKLGCVLNDLCDWLWGFNHPIIAVSVLKTGILRYRSDHLGKVHDFSYNETICASVFDCQLWLRGKATLREGWQPLLFSDIRLQRAPDVFGDDMQLMSVTEAWN